MDPQHRIVAWSLAAVAFAPALNEWVNQVQRLFEPSLVLFAGVVAFAGVAPFVVTALALTVAPRGWLAFVATLSLVVVVSAATSIVDSEFYSYNLLGDHARSKIFWRDLGSAVTMAAIALLLWWTIRPHPWLRRLPWGGAAFAVFLEIALLIVLSWPFGRDGYLPPAEPVPSYSGAVGALTEVRYTLANAAPLLFGLLYVSMGMTRPAHGETKATLLAAVQSIATLPVCVAFDVIVGFIAFDLPNLKFIRPTLLTPRRLIAVAGLQDVAVIFALFSGSIVSLLTGQVSAVATAAIRAAFPNVPIPPVPGQH